MAAMDKDMMTKEENGWVQTKPVGSDSYSAEMQMQEMGVVADKWKGTEADQHDMRMLGRSQVLRVSWIHGRFERVVTDVYRSATLVSCQFWALQLS